LPEIVAQMKAGSNRIQLGNIWPKRDYIHVRDAALGFAAAALHGEVAPGECMTVNLGTSQQHSVAEILEYLQETSGIAVTIEEDPARVRAVDRPFLGAAINRIEAQFGWRPRYTVRDAIEALWAEPDFTPELRSRYAVDAEP
jgi:UDP-glucose 4-epimerase